MAALPGARKAPSSAGGSSKNSTTRLVDQSLYDKVIAASDKKSATITLRKPLPSQTDLGNWLDSKSSKPKPQLPKATTANSSETSKSASPLVNAIENRMAAAFPSGRAFEERNDTVQCKHCKKPVLRFAAPAHIRECLKKKQEKQQKKKEAKEAKDAALRKERNGGVSPAPSVGGENETKRGGGGAGGTGARKTANDADADAGSKKTTKKRKADDEAKGPAKKKKKDEPKPKVAKAKGPVDVEKQCGVLLANGAMCARSLTCKSHSMGAKRAVPGRSMPYDVLLAQYQKKNQAKQQRAAMDANAPLPDDFEPPGTVDSDEERDAVMAGINRAYKPDPYTGRRLAGTPLATASYAPIRRKYQTIRLKGLLQQAMGGARGANLFSTLSQTAAGGDMPAPSSAASEGFEAARRASMAGRGGVVGRKQSVSAQG